MNNGAPFEPKIVAFVCNWCTYLGADLAGTNRLDYPANVRIIRLPCTGRIDFNFIVRAIQLKADAVLVSGCHPGDCHYTSGNYHARRRWMLFRPLLEVLGFDLRRIHFTWISAAEGRKFQQVVTEITEQTRQLGPAAGLPAPSVHFAETVVPPVHHWSGEEEDLREEARQLLSTKAVDVVIGHGRSGPTFITRPEEVSKLVAGHGSSHNLTVYLKRKEVRALGRSAVVVKTCDRPSLAVLERESQLQPGAVQPIPIACQGMAAPKCDHCEETQSGAAREDELEAFLKKPESDRLAFWASEFDRCIRCYACRQACPLCYCERCLVDKNRPQVIDTSPTLEANFAWHITRAFHLAGRCTGCDACTEACPAHINLRLLNLATAKAAREHFPAAEPVVGVYSLSDREDFIR
jgi:coenzyme F420-reducing hydrogenase delta subunit/ferredoxin